MLAPALKTPALWAGIRIPGLECTGTNEYILQQRCLAILPMVNEVVHYLHPVSNLCFYVATNAMWLLFQKVIKNKTQCRGL